MADKERKKKAKTQKSGKNVIMAFYNDLKGEFKKVIWPTKKELAVSTVQVIVASLIIGVVIISMDSVYGLALRLFSAFIAQ